MAESATSALLREFARLQAGMGAVPAIGPATAELLVRSGCARWHETEWAVITPAGARLDILTGEEED